MSGIIVPTHPGNLWSNAFGFTLASSKICIDTASASAAKEKRRRC